MSIWAYSIGNSWSSNMMNFLMEEFTMDELKIVTTTLGIVADLPWQGTHRTICYEIEFLIQRQGLLKELFQELLNLHPPEERNPHLETAIQTLAHMKGVKL